MIRQAKKQDIDRIMEIWLETNIQAHDFIDKNYWKNNFDAVKQMIPKAEVYVSEENGEIHGFAGLSEDYIAGIFVRKNMQSAGFGKRLLDYIKQKKDNLTLHVYEKNERAVRFYEREQFEIRQRQIDEDTGEAELLMQWRRKI